MLVTVGDWSSSTTTDYHNKTVTANARNIKTGERHWIDGKKWKYRTWEELDRIHEFINQLKLKVGIIQPFSTAISGQPNYEWFRSSR